jgi:hypothetical protein
MREILKEFAKTLNHEKFITGMIYSEFTNQVIRIAKTIYPLSNCSIIKCKLVSVPEGGEDTVYVTIDEDFDVVEVDVKRSRKSDIKRTERINVKKLTKNKPYKKPKVPVDDIKPDSDKVKEEVSEKST